MILFLLNIEKINLVETDETKKYLFKKDKLICLASKFLKKYLLQYLNLNPKDFTLMKNKFGKPHFYNQYTGQKVNFNLSHDNQFVVLFYNNNLTVGIDLIDLQKNKKIIKNLENTLHPDDKIICNQNNFFYIWAFKESYYKYLGSGINLELLKSISYKSRSNSNNYEFILKSNKNEIKLINHYMFKKLYFVEIKFNDYLINICFNNTEDRQIVIHNIDQ